MKLLIDGDILCYATASVGDGKKWQASDGYKERYKKDIIKYADEKGLEQEFVEVYEPEPIEHVLHSLKLMLENGVFEEFDSITGYKIFLTGKNNYREDVATILPYKGNRKDTRRPHWLPKCREYLIEQWGAVVEEGQEADDAMGIHQDKYSDLTDENTIICTIDKDLDCIPGWHFNWDKNKKYFVTELDALRNFYGQLITGDSTDNILGLFGVGAKSTILKKIRSCQSEAEMVELVWEAYFKRFGNYAKQFLEETGQLIWIRREQDELWELPVREDAKEEHEQDGESEVAQQEQSETPQ